jgi:hypothetical protein
MLRAGASPAQDAVRRLKSWRRFAGVFWRLAGPVVATRDACLDSASEAPLANRLEGRLERVRRAYQEPCRSGPLAHTMRQR